MTDCDAAGSMRLDRNDDVAVPCKTGLMYIETGLVESRSGLEQPSVDLLKMLFPLDKSVRLLGLSLSALNTDDEPESPQLSLEL